MGNLENLSSHFFTFVIESKMLWTKQININKISWLSQNSMLSKGYNMINNAAWYAKFQKRYFNRYNKLLLIK